MLTLLGIIIVYWEITSLTYSPLEILDTHTRTNGYATGPVKDLAL